MPSLVADGYGVLGMRGGTALPLTIGERSYLLPSLGASAILVAGEGGGGAVLGVNAGIAVASAPSGSTGLRAGITWHSLADVDSGFWLAELGIAFVPGRKR